MRNKILFTLTALLLMATGMRAQTPYAVYESGTLTFKYDENKPEGQFVYELNEGKAVPNWLAHSLDITTVVFDKSFRKARPKTFYKWFSGFQNLTEIKGLANLNTSNVTDMVEMFYDCSSLTSLYLDSFNTSSVTDMSLMFYSCENLELLDLSNFDTSSVTDMGEMFRGCRNLKLLNLSRFNTSNVTNMSLMFYSCENLELLDLSNFDTSNVTNMGEMFRGCNNLKSLKLSRFNTLNVTNMSQMFYSCENLEWLDLSNFDTSNVTNMGYMFYGCTSLESLGLSKFNTSNVTDMQEMFAGCSALKKLDMSKVTGIKKLAAHNDLQKRSIIIIVPEDTDIAKDVSEENYIVMGDKTLFVRTFAANNPHTLYLPFAVSTTDINGCFYEYDSCDGNSVKFTKVKEGATEANKAYLFKSETDEKIVFTGEGAIKTLPTSEEEDGAPGLYGRYTTKTFTAAEANEGIYYGWAGGEFKRAGEDAKVKPNRAYLKLPASDASNAPARLSVKFEDENTTGIINIEREDSGTESPIYNLNGQRVGNSYRGVVIKNGKKIMNRAQ